MRRAIVQGLLFAATGAALLSAQQPVQPPGTVLREPFTALRAVEIIPPPDDAPMELDPAATLSLSYPLTGATLAVSVRSRHREALPASGVTLRLAVGPLYDPSAQPDRRQASMVSIRMQPSVLAGGAGTRPAAAEWLLPRVWEPVLFSAVPADPPLPILVMKRDLRIVATLERVTDGDDKEIWVNPASRELLWDALRAVTSTEPLPRR